MNEEKEKAPAQAPQTKAATGPKVWKYIGPVPGPTIGNLPGTDIYYNGTLDEVVFDPPDGGRPPSSPTRYRIYFPGLQR